MKRMDYKLFIIIGTFYLFIEMLGITCPIKFITGISCAGCGMSRAMFSLIKFDLHSAFHHHPLFIFPFIFIIIYFIQDKLPKNTFKIICTIMAIIMIIVYIIRIFDGDNDIVVFKPQEGFIYQILVNFFNR